MRLRSGIIALGLATLTPFEGVSADVFEYGPDGAVVEHKVKRDRPSATTGPVTGLSTRALQHHATAAQAARKFGLDAGLVLAVIQAESGGDIRAVSPKGARGLMQLMPETAKRFGVGDVFEPTANVHAGTQYLAWLLKRYRGNVSLALAAYNAGEGAVDRYKGVPPYAETRAFVARVGGLLGKSFGTANPGTVAGQRQMPLVVFDIRADDGPTAVSALSAKNGLSSAKAD